MAGGLADPRPGLARPGARGQGPARARAADLHATRAGVRGLGAGDGVQGAPARARAGEAFAPARTCSRSPPARACSWCGSRAPTRGGRTVGVEISEGMLAQTRRRLEHAGLAGDVEVIEGSALELPLADESFDLIVNGYMLDLLPRDDIPRALAEFKRVLRPGGRLVLSNMTKGERRRAPRSGTGLTRTGRRGHRQLPRRARGARPGRARLRGHLAGVPLADALSHRDRHRAQGGSMSTPPRRPRTSARPCASATPRRPRRASAGAAGCCGPAESSCGCGTNALAEPRRARSSAPSSTRARIATRSPTRRSSPRSAAETRRPSPSSTRAKRSSISARAAGSTSCCRPAGSGRPARRTGST